MEVDVAGRFILKALQIVVVLEVGEGDGEAVVDCVVAGEGVLDLELELLAVLRLGDFGTVMWQSVRRVH